jgi:hypothetical protein
MSVCLSACIKVSVGFSPRMHAFDTSTGAMQYLKWQHTWWSGTYSIMLTKASIFHKKYLGAFFEVVSSYRRIVSSLLCCTCMTFEVCSYLVVVGYFACND